jgi:dihydrofolate reductase
MSLLSAGHRSGRGAPQFQHVPPSISAPHSAQVAASQQTAPSSTSSWRGSSCSGSGRTVPRYARRCLEEGSVTMSICVGIRSTSRMRRTVRLERPGEGTIMRTLIVTEFITLDGVVDSPGGGEHPRAGWTFKEVPFVEDAYEIKGREQVEAGAMLIGRQSYDEFAPVWPKMAEFADYNAMPKYVVSTTLSDPEWNNTSVLRSLDEVAELKQGDGGNILVHGSPTLAKALGEAGLVDRYHLLVFPVTLGQGKRLFNGRETGTLQLVEHEAYSNGVVKNVFDVAH